MHILACFLVARVAFRKATLGAYVLGVQSVPIANGVGGARQPTSEREMSLSQRVRDASGPHRKKLPERFCLPLTGPTVRDKIASWLEFAIDGSVKPLGTSLKAKSMRILVDPAA